MSTWYMPFGLTNAPVTFQDLINDIFKLFLRKFVEIFLMISWDIVNQEEHLIHFMEVLELLKYNYLYAKRSKCKFSMRDIDYLGLVINAQGVMADSSKVASMLEWPDPKNAKSLRDSQGFMVTTKIL